MLPGWATTHAQTTVTDDVSLQQLPIPPNVIGTYVRGASNDGKRLVFDSINDYNGNNVDSNTEIYVYDVDTRSVIQVTNTKNLTDSDGKVTLNVNNVTPVISGDGTKIAFVSNAELGGTTNADGNYEIYLADLPRGATTATFTRITDTAGNNDTEVIKEVFSNYTPAISDNGSVLAFLSTRKTFNAIAGGASAYTALKEGPNNSDPDGNAEIFIYDVAGRRYSQVTVSRDVDATVNFVVKGFNNSPHLSGDGKTLVFTSGFNYPGANANKNSDFNGEIFLYKVGDQPNTFTQITDTTGTAVIPVLNLDGTTYSVNPVAPMNLLPYGTHPLSVDGGTLVFESAGNFTNNNAGKARQVFVYKVATKTFTQVTSQTASATPTQAELKVLDYNFRPSVNSTGSFVAFASVLNLTPATTSNVSTDNADASREVFRYDLTTGKFRELTFSTASSLVVDQRDTGVAPFIDSAGTLISFSFDASQITPKAAVNAEPFQALVRPVTAVDSSTVTLANAASFDTTQLARGSIIAAFGTNLAKTTGAATSSTLPYVLNGVSINVNGIGAKMIYVSGGQINFVAPLAIATGDTVPFTINNNGVLFSGTLKLVDVAPGVFSLDGSGKGKSTAQCGRVSANGLSFDITPPPCSVGNDSLADVLVIYGTGWRNGAGIQVLIADQTLTPTYAGAQPDFEGLDQINVNLTQALADMKDLTITVSQPGTTAINSNLTTTSFLPVQNSLVVSNAASFDAGFVASGSVCFATGTNLSNDTATVSAPEYPVTLKGVTVTAGGVAARISYVSPTQVNFVMPDTLSPADLVEVVVNNNGTISRGRVKVYYNSPGIFTTTGDGAGAAQVQCYKKNADGSATFSAAPCAAGTDASPSYMRIVGTGWHNSDVVKVSIGGTVYDSVFFADLAPRSSGIDIVDIVVTSALAGLTDQEIIIQSTRNAVERDSKAGVKVSFKP